LGKFRKICRWRDVVIMKNQPYYFRKWMRERSPWFIVNIGLFRKGYDCSKYGGEHDWYKSDVKTFRCYYCRQEKNKQ